MAIDWKQVRERWLSGGVISALGAIVGMLILSVVDGLTGQFIPRVVSFISERYDPPTVTLRMEGARSLLPKDGLHVSFASTPEEVFSPTYKIINSKSVLSYISPGSYVLQLMRKGDGGLVQISSSTIFFKAAGETVNVDLVENDWVAVQEFSEASESPAPNNAAEDVKAVPSIRWSASPDDYAVTASISTRQEKEILAAALLEVGIGYELDAERVMQYWHAASHNPDAADAPRYWGGAFLAWITARADIAPPQRSVQFKAWQTWGREVSLDNATAGMLAIFDRANTPSRLNIGVILRKRPECIEIISGYVLKRVAISCVNKNLLTVRAAPSAS